jgi:Flp pilus assembly protein TadG
MMDIFNRLARDRAGSAAAEMMLVVPIFVALMFGSFELGHFYVSEHVVQKAVRDAARYAGRLPVTNFDCGSATVNTTAAAQIKSIARRGDPVGTNPSRLEGWTSDAMTTVSLACQSNTAVTYVNKGLYKDFPGGVVPVVTVSAAVPYPTLFGTLGLSSTTLQLNAASQSAVYGA